MADLSDFGRIGYNAASGAEYPAMTEDPLAMAVRHVGEGLRLVNRQRATIAKLAAAGCSTLDAERTLVLFESTLAIFVDHERSLRAQRERAA